MHKLVCGRLLCNLTLLDIFLHSTQLESLQER